MKAAITESPTQTVASSITATLRDSWLRLRCRIPRSAKIFTITGTALTESARPAKTANDQAVASGPRSLGSANSARTRVDGQRKSERAETDQPDGPEPCPDEREVDRGTGHPDQQHAAEQRRCRGANSI